MGKVVDLIGRRYGDLVVLNQTENKGKQTAWLCGCVCGSTKVIRGNHLKSGKTKSCGCRIAKHKHTVGHKNSPTYVSWAKMKQRCLNPNSNKYHLYGGRGVVICDEWAQSFEKFLLDMGVRPKGKTLDRIDVNGNYEPSNCRWATAREQRLNQRSMLIQDSKWTN